MTGKPAGNQPAAKTFVGVDKRWSAFPAENSPAEWTARTYDVFASGDLLTIPGFRFPASALYTAERRRCGTRFEESQLFFARMCRTQLQAAPLCARHPFASLSARGAHLKNARTSEENACAHVSPQRGNEVFVNNVFEGRHLMEPHGVNPRSTDRSETPPSSTVRDNELKGNCLPLRQKIPPRHRLGSVSRLLLQVNSVSVRSSSATMQEANGLRRLLWTLRASKKSNSTVPHCNHVPDGNKSHKGPVSARSNRSLRLLLAATLLLAAFVVASGFFAGKHADTIARRERKLDMEHGEFLQHATKNITVENVVLLHQSKTEGNRSGAYVKGVRHTNASSAIDAARALKGQPGRAMETIEK